MANSKMLISFGLHSDIGGGNGNTDLSDITLKWMLSKARAAGLSVEDSDIPSWPSPVTAEPHPDVKLPIPVRTVGAVDRRHYSVASLDGWTNPPPTCPPETEDDERHAAKVGDVSVASLPLDQRRKVVAMREAATAQAKALEMTLEPATYDHLMYLFESRLPLIVSDADLIAGQKAASVLVQRAVSNARHAPFPTVEPVFLTQAIWQTPGLFPLTD